MKLKLTHKKYESSDIWSFYFEAPEVVTWQAGQSIKLELPKASWGNDERRFTIASAPDEKHIRIITRITESGFKQSLKNFERGREVVAHSIDGKFVWQDDGRPKILLAAGIGITPYLSMLKQLISRNMKINASLIYSSSDDPIPLMDELSDIARLDDSLSLIPTTGRIQIDPDDPHRVIWNQSTVYVSGPEQMVRDVSQQLIKSGLPEHQLKTDLFTGYM